VNALTTPTTPALTITGGASGSYTYFVYALDNTGTNYSASAGVATTSGPTTLGVSNTIRVNCPAAVTGQVGSYEVVRSAGGTNQGIIGTCAGSGSLTDNGISATSTTKTASTNTTGYSLFPGPVGIGAASPYTPLDVVGIVRSDRVVNSQYVQMNGGDSNGMYISAVSGSGNKNFSITNNDPNGNLTLNAGSTAGALYLNAGGITGVTVSDLGAVVIGNGSIPLYVCSGGTFDGLFATAAAKCTGGSGTATKLSLQ
jgi:hypothetical protein